MNKQDPAARATRYQRPRRSIAGRGLAMGGMLVLASLAFSQTGYQIGEDTATADTGPVRLARVSYLSGGVDWRPTTTLGWSAATNNLPIRQGAQIWAKPGGRAEIQFDDGSTMRLGGGAVATLQTLYSDDHGEYTEIKLVNGIGNLDLRNANSVFQVDAPLGSVKAAGIAKIRVGVAKSFECACKSGNAVVDAPQGSIDIHPHERLDIADESTPLKVTSLPEPDEWEHFNDNRDVIMEHHNEHVPANIDLVSGDLDAYGDWHNDPQYGYVWAPHVHEDNWRPYHEGRWTWVSPWGWTWVGNEDWGYAPYHYGTWLHASYGWAWSPGPAVQYWSPAVVDFEDGGVNVGWAPFAPGEIRYPNAIDIGFTSGNWSVGFSIGQVACYYPSGNSYCEGRPWNNRFANQQVNVYSPTIINNNYNGNRVPNYRANNAFIPRNASRFAGMSVASRGAFLGGGNYQAPAADPRGRAFRTGRTFGSAPTTSWQQSGPLSIKPTLASFSPTKSVGRNVGPSPTIMQRSVVRASMPAAIQRQGGTIARSIAPNERAVTPGRVTPNRTNPERANPARANANATNVNRNNAFRANTNRTNTARANTARVNTARVNTARANTARTNTARANVDRTNAVRANQARPAATNSSAGFRANQARTAIRGNRKVTPNRTRQPAAARANTARNNAARANRAQVSRAQANRQQPQRQAPARRQPQRQPAQRQPAQRQPAQRQPAQRQPAQRQQPQRQPQRQQPQRQQPQRQQPQRQPQQRQQPQRQQPQRQQPQRQQPQRQQPQRQQPQRQQRQPSRNNDHRG